MTKKRKILIGVGVAVVLVILAVGQLRKDSGKTVGVRVEQVKRRDLVAKVTASGHIEAKRSVDISADISGRVVQLPVEEGQNVKEGQLLLVIDPASYRASVEQAQAGLAEATAGEAQSRAAYQQSERDWGRVRSLKEAAPNLVTEQEVETARTDAEVKKALWEAAEHGVERARGSLSEAQDLLGKTVIRAPMSGRITRLNVERGETAIVGTMNNPGSLLLTIADLSEMEAVVQVDETDVPSVHIGDSTTVEIDAFPDRKFVGRVTKIGNSSVVPRSQTTGTSDQAINFEVRIELASPPANIRPDLSATAEVMTATRQQALSIPIIALALMPADQFHKVPNENLPPDTTGDASHDVEGVFVVDGDHVRFRPVKVGIAGDNYFEVLDGLEEGETVVSGTYQAIRELKDGSRIKVVSPPSGAPTDKNAPPGAS